MPFYTQEEREHHLYLAILDEFNDNKELVVTTYYGNHLKEFPDFNKDYQPFLQTLMKKGYIKYGCLSALGTLVWGENIEEWRKKMEAFAQKNTPVSSGPIINGSISAQNIHMGTGNIEINNSDAEKIVSLMKELVENSSVKNDRVTSIKDILSSGKTVIDIIKSLVALC